MLSISKCKAQLRAGLLQGIAKSKKSKDEIHNPMKSLLGSQKARLEQECLKALPNHARPELQELLRWGGFVARLGMSAAGQFREF